MYLGAALILSGESTRGLRLLNEAIRVLPPGPLRGEGHYWRARHLLSRGRIDQGWWDLQLAAEEDPHLIVPASQERLEWGVRTDDPTRAAAGARVLLVTPAGADRLDSLQASVQRAAQRWGPAQAADLLAPAREGPWPPGPRERILLYRARLLVMAGDTLAAESEAGWIAAGAGEGAVEARLFLAELRGGAAADVAELAEARTVLLPVSGHARVVDLAEDLRTVELLVDWGHEDAPEALFAAAELARDRLAAPALARNLFLAYADEDPTGSWAGKALLAALALEPDPERAALLRARLRERAADPYVRALTPAPTGARRAASTPRASDAELARREARLRERLTEIVERGRAEARRRDVRLRADTTAAPGR
jgi:hypothetical protein